MDVTSQETFLDTMEVQPSEQFFDYQTSEDRHFLQQQVRKRQTTTEQFQPEQPQPGPRYQDYQISEDRNILQQQVTKRQFTKEEEQPQPQYFDYEVSQDSSLLERNVRQRRLVAGEERPEVTELTNYVDQQRAKTALAVLTKPRKPQETVRPLPLAEQATLDYFVPTEQKPEVISQRPTPIRSVRVTPEKEYVDMRSRLKPVPRQVCNFLLKYGQSLVTSLALIDGKCRE